MKKVLWFLQRISVMNAQEVIHRISEQLRLATWNVQYMFGFNTFIRGADSDFSFCTGEKSCFPQFSWKPVERQEVVAIADGKVGLFNGSIMFDLNVNERWRTAPETNKLWPLTFFNSIDCREGNPFGDIRIAWEASRLQYLITLAVYVKQNPETKLKTRLLHIIRTDIISWHNNNPLMQGIHYVSSMECAIRLIALTVTCDLVRSELTNDRETWKALARIVLEHAYFIRRRLSLWSSTGNHTLAEAAGLIYAGALFYEHGDASEWLDTGLRLFTQELDHQIDAQGVGKEQAIQYTVQILEYGVLVERLLKHNAMPVPDALIDALARGIRDVKIVNNMLGTIPPLGDSDSGRALSPYFNELWDYPTKLNNQAVYSNGSLTVMQGQDAMAEFAAVIDHGPLGMQPKYSHGHADALSVTLYRKNHAVLVDPGTYSYTGAPKLRNYFRSTKAHNTAMIDSLDQATSKMLFMWSKPYRCNVLHLESNDKYDSIVAQHDGYNSIGVEHVRQVVLHHRNGLAVFDDFTAVDLAGSTEEHTFNLYWHINGKVEQIENKNYLIPDDKLNISFSETLSPKVITAAKSGYFGWKSTSYFSRTPISTLILSGKSRLPFSVVTTFSHEDESQTADDSWRDEFARMRAI